MNILQRFLRPICDRLSPSRTQIVSQIPTCEERLAHAATLGFSPRIIYDCGAFVGKWAKSVNALYPDAKLVLIEPNGMLYDQIRSNTSTFSSQCTLIECAVSEHAGSAVLNVWQNDKHTNPETALAASSLQPHVQGKPSVALSVETKPIDAIVAQLGLTPDLLKLDLQGHELPALRGAVTALRNCEMVIVEFGCLDAYVDRTTSRDLMNFLYDLDFVLYDIVDMRYRPYDGGLTGGDFFFAKKASSLKAHKDYF